MFFQFISPIKIRAIGTYQEVKAVVGEEGYTGRCIMGSACTSQSSAVHADVAHKDMKPLVPYIVVSSVSLSREYISVIAIISG